MHKTIDKLFNQMWNQHNPVLAKELFADDFKVHYSDDTVTSINDFIALLEGWFQGVPDIHHEVNENIEQGNKVITRWYGHGTHSGEFVGLKATGKPFHYQGVTIFTLSEDGKIMDAWVASDFAAQYENLKND